MFSAENDISTYIRSRLRTGGLTGSLLGAVTTPNAFERPRGGSNPKLCCFPKDAENPGGDTFTSEYAPTPPEELNKGEYAVR